MAGVIYKFFSEAHGANFVDHANGGVVEVAIRIMHVIFENNLT